MLLDNISPTPKTFHPATASEFLGLRIATKLNDLENLYAYLRLCHRVSEETVIAKLADLISSGVAGLELAEAFRSSFNH